MKEFTKTIGQIVAEDYRTAKVFEDHGIDFCCGGKVALSTTCLEKGIDLAMLTGELEAVRNKPVEKSQNFTSFELPFLIDYIVNVHHNYIKENAGQIAKYAYTIAEVHGAHHPEVVEIAAIFDTLAADLAVHLKEEEDHFFPVIKRFDRDRKAGAIPADEDTLIIKNSLEKLIQDHEQAGEAIHTIRRLAKGYTIPEDVCNTFVITYQRLKEFEDDLHKHVHLENNILFLKAGEP
jgi:regulator of cell morphogenesis and NO signaling